MVPTSRKILIPFVPVLIGLAAFMGAMLFAHHGGISYARFASAAKDLSSLNGYNAAMVSVDDQARLYSYSSSAVELSTYGEYLAFESEYNETDSNITVSYFYSYKLFVVARQGSYYILSQVNSAKVENDRLTLAYYIEDNQVLSGQDNLSGVYTIDFFRISQTQPVNEIVISDHLF